MEFVVIDDCPVPDQLADEIRKIKQISGATLNSCDRSPEAEPILAEFGKHSQKQLYDMFIHHAPGANPANRPGQSTHERRNDGIAYPGPLGEQLEYSQVGWTGATRPQRWPRPTSSAGSPPPPTR